MRRSKLSSLFLQYFFTFTIFIFSTPAAYATSIYHGIGYDVSYPNCDVVKQLPKVDFGIVGINRGKAFTQNPCLAEEFQWALGLNKKSTSVYMNINAPIGSTSSRGATGPYTIFGICLKNDTACQAFNYGFNAAQYAYEYAVDGTLYVHMWWLDVETANSWFDDPLLNRQVLQGAIAFFKGGISPGGTVLFGTGLPLGTYSTPHMWREITGNWLTSGLPAWVATDADTAPESCLESFTEEGKQAKLIQFYDSDNDLDANYACK
jgi:hypothetical protein